MSEIGGTLSSDIVGEDFPNLNEENHEITSDKDQFYNCIAYTFEDNKIIWWPTLSRHHGHYWPPNILIRGGIFTNVIRLLKHFGFEECIEADFEPGFQKVAVYVHDLARMDFSHIAKQLNTGQWTSKLGSDEDIRHDSLECLAGPSYGTIGKIFKRHASINTHQEASYTR